MSQVIEEMTPMFLARIGKTVLRPGGKATTNWLLEQCKLHSGSQVLEVACNIGTTASYMARTYECQVTAIDIHEESVRQAQRNIEQQYLTELVRVEQADALTLPYADASFDVVVNEAMLTSLSEEQKVQALAEYNRVLKPGGILATHDMVYNSEIHQLLQEKVDIVWELNHVAIEQQLTEAKWRTYYEQAGFEIAAMKRGNFQLLTLVGLLADEGLDGVVNILQQLQQNEQDKLRFIQLAERLERHQTLIGHVAFITIKQ